MAVTAMQEYVVRANLEFLWDWGQQDPTVLLKELPLSIGPFRLDQSPNIDFYLTDLGLVHFQENDERKRDDAYPTSLLYVEGRLQVPPDGRPLGQADELFASLESLFRLFQPGGVSVKRYSANIQKIERGVAKRIIYFNPRPVPRSEYALYRRQQYPIGAEFLCEFTEFFNRYWDVFQKKSPSHLITALMRFSSSYEKSSLPDRLIDLVIALEALFGDGESGSIAYKVATRCAFWLHPPGKERLDTFKFIKKAYDMRSRSVHGGQKESPSEIQLNQLEHMVRASLIKLLGSRSPKGKTPHGSEIDNLIMTGKL